MGVYLPAIVLWRVGKSTVVVLLLGNVDGSVERTAADTGLGSGRAAQPNSTDSAGSNLRRRVATVRDSQADGGKSTNDSAGKRRYVY